MEVAIEIGTSPLGDDCWSSQVLSALLTLQGKGAYATSDDSARVGELYAWSIVLADGTVAMEAIANNLTPHLSEELLGTWEQSMRLPNDAARTNEERQARVVAFKALTGVNSATKLDEAGASLGLDAPAVWHPTRAANALSGAEDSAGYQAAYILDSADWTTKRRADAATLLRRMLPAYAYGQHRHAEPEAMLATDHTPKWSGTTASKMIGRTTLIPEPTVNGTSYMTRPIARIWSAAGASRVNARDLNHLQDAMFMAPCAAADNDALANDLTVARTYFFACSVAGGGGTAQIAQGLDFRQRYIQIAACWSASDIRPGQANDILQNVASFDHILWATIGGVASRAIGASNVTLLSSATAITASNANAATRYLVGVLRVSPPVNSGTKTSRLTSFADGDTFANVTPALWTGLRDAGMPKAANGGGVDTWAGYPTTAHGAVCRTVVMPTTSRPVSGANTYVLDSSIDWRDRLMLVEGSSLGTVTADPIFPGVTGDRFFNLQNFGSFPMYTGTGITPGSDTLSAYEFDLPSVRLAVRATDGALIVQHHASSGAEWGIMILNISASDQLQERSAATPLAVPAAPIAAADIEPFQINWLQDGSIYSQALEKDDGTVPVSSMPLGPVVKGHTRTPIEWRESRREGRLGSTLRPRRQVVADRVVRYFAADIANGATVTLDASIDWRDRIVQSLLNSSANDIRPGGANEADINSVATEHTVFCGNYTGSGGDSYPICSLSGASPNHLRLRVNASTGALELANNVGGTRYVVGFVIASFPLGPRSV